MQARKASMAGTSFGASLLRVAGTSFERSALLFYWKLTSICTIRSENDLEKRMRKVLAI